MVRICAEETFHYKQGKEMIVQYMETGTAVQREEVQDGLNRWWWPMLMMFGPHDSSSSNTPQLMRWGVKTKTNDTLRQEFINEEVPAIHALGLTIPDPDLHFNEASGDWHIGEIDWDEFWKVIKGDGPMNKERLATRKAAHDNGLWVREAVTAYAEREVTHV
jgi:ring-1,2-phenylacetyl-CoA epoxidase subunit PaaA